ncbi:MAG: hypothetical protein ACTSXJ_03095 [Candidatus Baldrarchaeia archaeon]
MDNYLKRLEEALASDPAKRAILEVLLDGEWHSTVEIWRKVRSTRKFIGLVGIGTAIRQMVNLTGNEIIECKNGVDISEWRLKPEVIEDVRKLLENFKKPDRHEISRDYTDLILKGQKSV